MAIKRATSLQLLHFHRIRHPPLFDWPSITVNVRSRSVTPAQMMAWPFRSLQFAGKEWVIQCHIFCLNIQRFWSTLGSIQGKPVPGGYFVKFSKRSVRLNPAKSKYSNTHVHKELMCIQNQDGRDDLFESWSHIHTRRTNIKMLTPINLDALCVCVCYWGVAQQTLPLDGHINHI